MALVAPNLSAIIKDLFSVVKFIICCSVTYILNIKYHSLVKQSVNSIIFNELNVLSNATYILCIVVPTKSDSGVLFCLQFLSKQ